MQNLKNQLIILIIFFIISFLLQSFIISRLKKWFLDKPDYRSLHQLPTPSGGGLIFVLVGSIGALYFNFLLPLICLPLSIIGLIDDRFNLSRKLRYFFQFSTVIIFINISPLKINLDNSLFEFVSNLILIIFLTGIINFINFMDGIDGLVAGSMIVYFSLFAVSGNIGLVPLIGSLMAFLIFNWNPAKVFMGDVGSTFLGSLYAGLLLQFTNWNDSFTFLVIATPLFLDALVCLIRRFLTKDNIFKPHRKHLYQRLIGQKNLSHGKVSLIYISTSILSTIFFYLGSNFLFVFNLFFVVLLGCYLDRFIAKPFKFS